jgi:CRISPR-associated protein Csd1
MLLQRLVQYARMQPPDQCPPPFHAQTRVAWLVDLDAHGHPVTGELAPLSDPADPSGRRGLPTVAPVIGRTLAVVPALACDKIEYALGWTDPDKTDDPSACRRAARYHDAFTELAGAWAAAHPEDPVPAALHRFLSSNGAQRLRRPERYTRGDNVLFRVDGRVAHQAPSVRTFWPSVARKRKTSAQVGRCLVCAVHGPLLERAPRPVKAGLIPTIGHDPDSKSEAKRGNGPHLVSVNSSAYGFNLEIGLTHTPLCESCAEAYTFALERLLTLRGQTRTVGDTAFIWWISPDAPHANPGRTPPSTDSAPVRLLFRPDPVAIAAILDAPRKGRPISAGNARTDRFCAATLSNNSSRIVVRDWLDIPLPQAEAHIASWFQDMKATDPWRGPASGEPHYPSLFRLLLALGRWQAAPNGRSGGSYAPLGLPNARRPVWAQRELLHAAINGTPLSTATLAHLISRIRTDRRLDPTRQALLHLCMTRCHPNSAQELPMALDTNDDRPAYLAGRLFAVLESLQYAATRAGEGSLNVTITDRYFNRAVTSPAATLIPAVRKSPAHLKKLRTHGKEASAAFFSRSINELLGRLKPFPTVLTIQSQGLWLNGYADQRNDDIARIRARGLSAQDLVPDTDESPSDPSETDQPDADAPEED